MDDNVASLLKDVRDLLTIARKSSPDNEGNSLFPPTVALTVEDLQLLHDTVDADELEIQILEQRVEDLTKNLKTIATHTTDGDCYVCDHLNWTYLGQCLDRANEERDTLSRTLDAVRLLNIPEVNKLIGELWYPGM